MGIREQFQQTMAGRTLGSGYPVLEWASWWPDTIAMWEEEGLPKGLSRQELYDYFGLDRNIQFWFRHVTNDCPERRAYGAPFIESVEDYKAFKRYLYPKDAVSRWADDIQDAARQSVADQALVWCTVEGFFWFPRELFGIEAHLTSFYDEPDLYHRICEDLLEWQMAVLDEFCALVQPDFINIAEDMSYNHGSMISGQMFREFMTPYYRRLSSETRKRGIPLIVDSDGDISQAIPWFIEAGADGLFPLERQAGVDILQLQEAHPDFCWMGGFDKMCMFAGKDAIDSEFERLLPAIRRGRYIPATDHQTPPGVTIEHYRYYVKRLRECSRALAL